MQVELLVIQAAPIPPAEQPVMRTVFCFGLDIFREVFWRVMSLAVLV